MSIWSVFYSGDATRIETLLREQRLPELDNTAEFGQVDFSGGVRTPFLIGEDFDVIASHLNGHFGKCFASFSAVQKRTLWGDADGEDHAGVLDSEFVNLLGRLADRSLAEINRIILAKRGEQKKKIEQNQRISRIKDRFKIEIFFLALPFALSMGVILGSQFTMAAKVLVPVFSFGIAYGLRFWISQWLDSGRKKKQGPNETEDWMELLIRLRDLAKAADATNQSIVYVWSL